MAQHQCSFLLSHHDEQALQFDGYLFVPVEAACWALGNSSDFAPIGQQTGTWQVIIILLPVIGGDSHAEKCIVPTFGFS